MSSKYELLERGENGLRRIRALRDIPRFGVKAEDIGGYVDSEKNLSQDGDCWVCDNARVCDNALVCSGARVQQGQDLLCVVGLGSAYGTTTFYRTKAGISVACGCFSGTLEEFREKVRETHKDMKYAREYALACRLAKLHILGEENA